MISLGMGLSLTRARIAGGGGSGGAAPTIIVSHNFNGADSTTVVGNAQTGQASVPVGDSVWGISSNAGYSESGTAPPLIYWDALDADVTVEITAKVLAGTWSTWLILRYIDASNYFKLQIPGSGGDGNFYLTRWTAGAPTELANGAMGIVNTDKAALKAVGNSIRVLLNGSDIGGATDAQGNSATKHGFGEASANGGMRIDLLTISEAA